MRITITDRFLYSYIKSFTKNNKPVFASNEHISKEIGKSESVVSHSISRLIKLGYLENKGNKYSRQLYTKSNLVTADFNQSNADFNQSNADFNQSTVNNSITCDEIKRVIAENSNNEKLKTAIANAENSYILIKLLIKYTSIEKEIYKEKDLFENENLNKKDKIIKNKFGELKKVLLTSEEEKKLRLSYGVNFDLAIDTLDRYIASKNKRYASHYAVMKANGWVWNEVMKNTTVIIDKNKSIENKIAKMLEESKNEQ